MTLTLAGVPIFRESGTDNILVCGAPESGKGVAINELLDQTGADAERGVVDLVQDNKSIVWEPRRVSDVEVYSEENRTVEAGDRLRWTRNDRDLSRRNGDAVEVIFSGYPPPKELE